MVDSNAMVGSSSARQRMRLGWVLVFAVSLAFVLNGLVFLVTGAETDTQFFQKMTGTSWSAFASSGQGIAAYVQDTLRLLGVITALAGVNAAAIAYKAFRRAERWAFYVLFFGVFGIAYAAGDDYYHGGSTWPVYLVLLVVYLVGLFLPFNEVFGREKPAVARIGAPGVTGDPRQRC